MDENLNNIEEYARTRVSATGGDHTEIAKTVMGPLQREQLRHLIHFRFKRHDKYNLTEEIMKILEDFIVGRATRLLYQ
jgi:hypothetical protein